MFKTGKYPQSVDDVIIQDTIKVPDFPWDHMDWPKYHDFNKT